MIFKVLKVVNFMLKVKYLPFIILVLLSLGFLGCGSVNTNTTVTNTTDPDNGETGGSGSGGDGITNTNSIVVQDKEFITDTNQELIINLSTLVKNADSQKSYTFTIVSAPNIGLVAMQDELLTYTPSVSGTDSIEYKVSDGSSESNIGVISIEVKPLSVVVVEDNILALNDKTLTTMQDEAVAFNLSSIITNFDSNSTYNFAITSEPSLGSYSISGFTFTYTPEEGVIGNDQITLRAGDGDSTSNIATIDIQIQDPASSAPQLQNVSYTIDPNVPAVLDLNLLFKAPHPIAGKIYTFSILQQGKLGSGVISGSSLTYTPILNVLGATDTSMRILVKDELGQKTETPITIIISSN